MLLICSENYFNTLNTNQSIKRIVSKSFLHIFIFFDQMAQKFHTKIGLMATKTQNQCCQQTRCIARPTSHILVCTSCILMNAAQQKWGNWWLVGGVSVFHVAESARVRGRKNDHPFNAMTGRDR